MRIYAPISIFTFTIVTPFEGQVGDLEVAIILASIFHAANQIAYLLLPVHSRLEAS